MPAAYRSGSWERRTRNVGLIITAFSGRLAFPLPRFPFMGMANYANPREDGLAIQLAGKGNF